MSFVQERPAPPHSEGPEHEGNFEAERGHALSLASELLHAPMDEARTVAEVLKGKIAALPGPWPREQVHALVRQLLDDSSLTDHRSARAVHLRRELVGVLSRLGYPWALEITPEELRLLTGAADEENPSTGGGLVGAITFLAAMVSLPWNLLAALISGVMVTSRPEWTSLTFFVLASLGSVHSVLAMGASGGDAPTARRVERLRWLSKWAVLGPVAALATVAASGWHWNSGVGGLVVAGPSLLASLLCRVCAWRIVRALPQGKL